LDLLAREVSSLAHYFPLPGITLNLCWTQTDAGCDVIHGRDTFIFFKASEIVEPVGAFTVQFAQESIVITAGAGIFERGKYNRILF
jgi:hypothetical protein